MDHHWLDTETRAMLYDRYDKATLTSDAPFSLLLLTKGQDSVRIDFVIDKLNGFGERNSTSFPFILRQGLTLDDAIIGQFALACCDCISIFLRDKLVCEYDASDFAELFTEFRGGREFEDVDIDLVYVPPNGDGHRFLWQFLGQAVGVSLPQTLRVMRKKARLMEHCAERICGIVKIKANGGS